MRKTAYQGIGAPSWFRKLPFASGVALASVARRSRTLSSTVSAAPAPPMSVCTQPAWKAMQVAPCGPKVMAVSRSTEFKAALNSVLRDTALTFGPQGATCIAFHPGWVQTDMGGAGAAISAEDSVRDLRATLAKATPDANGTFLNHDGEPIPW